MSNGDRYSKEDHCRPCLTSRLKMVWCSGFHAPDVVIRPFPPLDSHSIWVKVQLKICSYPSDRDCHFLWNEA